ncbi:MAG: response regulator [Rhodospirillaceae bacterium]|nr:response regulator [Rhodospirillaceae bacterium]
MKTCLIVDDSTVVRMVARRILGELKFVTREAVNGAEALESCARSMPDAILLDWNMPVMTGIEFIEMLRCMSGGNVPRVLFCTTENEVGRIRQALDAGADEYIMKPFDSEILHTKLDQLGLIDA